MVKATFSLYVYKQAEQMMLAGNSCNTQGAQAPSESQQKGREALLQPSIFIEGKLN